MICVLNQLAGWDLFVWSLCVFSVPVWAPLSWYSVSIPQPKDMHEVNLTGESKLGASVNVSMNGCWSLL